MITITCFNLNEHQQVSFDDAPVLIGSDLAQLSSTSCKSIVCVNDSNVEPVQCLIEWTDPGEIKVTNYGTTIVMETGPRVFRNVVKTMPLPCLVRIGDTEIQIQGSDAIQVLDDAISVVKTKRTFGDPESLKQASPDSATVSAWFEAIGELNRSVAGSDEFFQSAAKALFCPGGLDGGFILQPVPDSDCWKVLASYLPYPEYSVSYREDLVKRCANEGATLFHDSQKIKADLEIDQMQGVVACPVLDEDHKVVAVVYGFRNQHRTNNRRGIRTLEMKFVQLIATSISTALVRIERETKAAQDRVLLEQAFSPKVAQQLGSGQQILAGRTQEVSILFADLRGFTTVSERIGTEMTFEVLTDVMDAFSQAIADEDGVIIDFYGDGLSAFWNAPLFQENHQELACRAALKIVSCLEPISKHWESRIGQRLRVGIGLHSGTAQVGNSGSRRRLKYGPQGAAVNLTSRLENVTKDIGVSMVVSDAIAKAVAGSKEVTIQRICNAKLAGTRSVTGLYELRDAGYVRKIPEFDNVLELFEASKFNEAMTALAALQIENELDCSTEFLLRQALARAAADGSEIELESGKDQIVALTNRDIELLIKQGKLNQPSAAARKPTLRAPVLREPVKSKFILDAAGKPRIDPAAKS